MTITAASDKDIAVIRTIAHVTWPVAYGNILSPAQLAYMLELMYSETALNEQMTTKEHHFLLAEKENTTIGFAGFEHNYQATRNSRLHKLYVLPVAQGAGAGKALLDAVVEAARAARDVALELNVNRFNRSKEFYMHQGFNVVREEVLDIGSGYVMDDYVMELTV